MITNQVYYKQDQNKQFQVKGLVTNMPQKELQEIFV